MAYTAWSVSQSEIPDTAKWNLLGGNDAHFYSFLGDDLEWQSYTPTINFTIGNGTVAAAYTRVGNTIFCRIRFDRGSTTVIPSGLQFSVPVAMTPAVYAHSYFIGIAYLEDYLITAFFGHVQTMTGVPNTVEIRIGEAASTNYVQTVSASAAVPFTWAASDYFDCYFSYECVA